MNFVIWIAIGGILGWLASIVMKTRKQQGTMLNVVAGIVGAVVGGGLIAPIFSSSAVRQNDFSISALCVALLGALLLLAVIHLLWREKSQ